MPLIDSAKTNFIIRLAKQGNEWAFGSLVKRFENDVFRFAYSFLGNAEDSQDVSQEVFWSGASMLSPESAPFC